MTRARPSGARGLLTCKTSGDVRRAERAAMSRAGCGKSCGMQRREGEAHSCHPLPCAPQLRTALLHLQIAAIE